MFLYLENRKRLAELKTGGRVFSINISPEKGQPKEMVLSGFFETGLGLRGDAHLGSLKRQVSLMSIEDIEKADMMVERASGLDLRPGIFAENITTEGLDLSKIKVGDRLHIGSSVILLVTQIGKECKNLCSVGASIGKCIMPKKGVFASVINGGPVSVRDEIKIVPSLSSRASLKHSIQSFLLGTK